MGHSNLSGLARVLLWLRNTYLMWRQPRQPSSGTGTDVPHTSLVLFVRGLLVNAMVFVVSTARVLARIRVRFAVRVFIVPATPAATLGLRLARDTFVMWMIVSTTLSFFAGCSRGTVSGVLGVVPVGYGHPSVPRGSGGGGSGERECPMDPNIIVFL